MSTWQQRTNTTGQQQGQQVQPVQASFRGDIDGQVIEILGDRISSLAWDQAQGGLTLVSGGTNYSILNDFKGSILKLWNEFFEGKTNIDLSKDRAELIKRRLFHLEHQMDGLLRRRIQFSVKDANGGERFLDYTGLLNEKETQIVELEKKIQNLEERLRRASQRESDLEAEILRLKAAILKLQKPGVSRADLQAILRGASDYKALEAKYASLRDRFAGFGSLIKAQSDKLRGSGITLDFEADLNALIRSEGVSVSLVNGLVNLVDFREKVVEVPVSDARTKHLIHMLAVQMKKFFEKYPKLREQCDVRLAEFFQQELIDIIEVDELDRVVEIVKYVPDVYRVENVYAYSSEKSRRVEFHLRVLIKALLEELEKLKRRTGAVLDIDEGIIGMINAEIMDVVNVDDILKVFRVVPKIVEVEKIVEKIVDRVIEIPQVVPVEKIVEKIIERPQIVEVEKIVHVPVEVIKYVDVHHDKIVIVEKETEKVVEVPRIVEKIIDRVVEIPKLVTQQVIVERVVEVQRPTIVERIINVPVIEIREVEVVREKIVPVERIIEKAVPVEVFVEKIVEKVVHVPQLVTVEKRNDILVKQIEVQNAREVVNHIQRVPEIHQITHEVPVPLIQNIERIVEVPKIMEKIVEVKVEVPTIKQVRVVEEKIVYKQKIVEVERIVTKTVEVIKQVEKIVDRRVEVPMIVEKIVRVPEIITQIVVERIENPVIVEVEKYVEKIVEIPKIIEVETVKTIEVTVDNPVKITVEKIVEVPKTIERIKQVRVNIEKIIEKMVEVPKVVEVEKIVEKIVVVPRVIEKIVEVPQIVEKIVDRIVESTQVIEVEKIVQVPLFEVRVEKVEVPVNNYITEKEIVEKVVEKIVTVEKVVSTVEVVKETSDKIVEHKVEVPKEVLVDRIVPVVHEVSKVVEIDRQIIVPVEVPIPVDRVIERVVPIERDVEKIVQVPQTIEKIVEVKVESVIVQNLVQRIEVPVQKEVIRQVERVVPYVQTEIKEVKLFEEKIILNNIEVEKIVPVDRFIEKLVTETHEIVKAIEVEKLVDKIIEVQKLITVENIVPFEVEVNKFVEVYRDRAIEIPLIHYETQEVKVIEEKVISIEHRDTQIKEVATSHDKIVQQEKLIIKTDIRNQIDTQIQAVDRYEDKIIPITTSIEKIIEVPYILEKIVEKIVIMPQVVEVLKYVHEIVEEESLGVAVGVDIYTQETKYKGLYGKLKIQFEALLVELRRLRGNNPALKVQIELIEGFLIELDKLIAFPRIVQVEKEKQVEVERKVPVLVPTLDLEAERFQVTLAMIISRLLGELMRIKEKNPNVKFDIDTEILKIFSDQYRDKSGLLQGADGKFGDSIHRIYGFYENFLTNLGGSNLSWEQQLIYTAALEERLLVASLIDEANLQVKKAQTISDKRGEAFRFIKQSVTDLRARFGELEGKLAGVSASDATIRGLLDKFRVALLNFDSVNITEVTKQIGEKPIYSGTLSIVSSDDEFPLLNQGNFSDPKFFTLFESRFRALTKENELLRDKYLRWQRERPNIHGVEDRDRIIDNLEKKIVELSSELNGFKTQSSVSVNVVGNTQQYELKIRTLNSKNQELESQLRTLKLDYESKLKSKDRELADRDREIQALQEKAKIGDSRVTGVGNSEFTPSSKTSFGGQDRMSSSGYSGTSGSEGGVYGNYGSTGGSRTAGGTSTPTGSATYGSTGFSGSGSGVSQTPGSGVYGTSGTTPQVSTGGASYGQTGTTGASYGQTGSRYGTLGQPTTSQVGGTTTGGASYGQTATSYGQSGQLSGSGATYSSQSGISQPTTGGVSYGQTGTATGSGSGSYASTGGYSRQYGSTGATGVSGTGAVGGATGSSTGGLTSSGYSSLSGSGTGSFSTGSVTGSGVSGTFGSTTGATSYGTGSSYSRYGQQPPRQ